MSSFVHPDVNAVKAFANSIQAITKHSFKLGYEVEFASPNRHDAHDAIRQTGIRFLNEYTSSRSRYAMWQVKHDRSIDPPRGYEGVEMASPPMDLPYGVTSLMEMFEWMSAHKAITNESCGLHVSISLKDPVVWKKLNPLALIYNFDDVEFLGKWKRSGNRYCRPVKTAVEKYINELVSSGSIARIGMNGIQDIPQLSGHIGRMITKHHAVNLLKMNDGYLEFRLMGGTDYHQKKELVLETILAIIVSFNKSIDAASPTPIVQSFTSVETLAKKQVDEFVVKMSTAKEKLKENRKLLGMMHKAANGMDFIRGNKQEISDLIRTLRDKIHMDADDKQLREDLRRHQESLSEISRLKNLVIHKRTVEAA